MVAVMLVYIEYLRRNANLTQATIYSRFTAAGNYVIHISQATW